MIKHKIYDKQQQQQQQQQQQNAKEVYKSIINFFYELILLSRDVIKKQQKCQNVLQSRQLKDYTSLFLPIMALFWVFSAAFNIPLYCPFCHMFVLNAFSNCFMVAKGDCQCSHTP